MTNWDAHRQTNESSNESLPYTFFSTHVSLLDAIDRYLIEVVCTEELIHLLCESIISMGGLNKINLALGPACVIFGYCAIGYALRISGQDAFHLANQGLLLHEQVLHEQAWKVIEHHLMPPIHVASQFKHSHRVPDMDIDIPEY